MSETRLDKFKIQRFTLEYDRRTDSTKEIPFPDDSTAAEVVQPHAKTSYTAFNSHDNIGVAAVVAKNKHQPHCVVSNQLEALLVSHLPDKAWEVLLKNTFTKLATSLNEKLPINSLQQAGASICATFLFKNKLHIANIGKNLVYLLTINTNNETEIQLVNSDILHLPTSHKETERLKKYAKENGKDFNLMVPSEFEKQTKLNGRLAGLLKVSRAFGLTDFVNDGLTHDPEIKHIDLPSTQFEQAFIITASASLISNIEQAADKIKMLALKYKNETPDIIAKAIAKELNGIRPPSRSNAVCVMPLKSDLEVQHAKYTAIISAHNNTTVSNALYYEFHSNLISQAWLNMSPPCSTNGMLSFVPTSKNESAHTSSLPSCQIQPVCS